MRWDIEYKNISCLFVLRDRYLTLRIFRRSIYERTEDSFYRSQTSRAQEKVYFITFQPTDIRQSLFSIPPDVPSIRLHPLALFEIDIDDPNSRFRRRYLPVVMYVREHNTAIVGKGNVIAYADFASSRVCSIPSVRISFITYVCIVSGTSRRG